MDFKFVGKALTFLPKKIDKKIEEEVADKTGVAVLAALQTLDTSVPILTTLLSGGKVELKISLQLVDTDGPSIPKKA